MQATGMALGGSDPAVRR